MGYITRGKGVTIHRADCPYLASTESFRHIPAEWDGGSGGKLSNFKNELTGCGPFLHNDPKDRPLSIFGGTTTLHFGGDSAPYLLLPVVPPK